MEVFEQYMDDVGRKMLDSTDIEHKVLPLFKYGIFLSKILYTYRDDTLYTYLESYWHILKRIYQFYHYHSYQSFLIEEYSLRLMRKFKRLYSKTQGTYIKMYCFGLITNICEYLGRFKDYSKRKMKYIYIENVVFLINSFILNASLNFQEAINMIIKLIHNLISCIGIQPYHYINDLIRGFLSHPFLHIYRRYISFYLAEFEQKY
ncbi:hypothetical protein RF11_15255 [Thelohanellus kitauei]|uniref:Uncharacterized protein n=1 Tax=Thelohanellus kitauei TaxID=669202 RepID=A0A0C2IMY1_THEKT|nr:hypothetical protein RF11_15255 [Thelohanellus kitauei]